MGSEFNRRKFIKSGLLATGGVVLASSYLGAKPLFFGDRKVRIGVIGAGDRGTGLSTLINEIDGLEVVAYADVIPFRLEAALKMTPGAKGYDSHVGLVKDPNVDAVLIATPFSTHDEVALAAMKAGKHIYCEKTMIKGLDRKSSGH